MKNLRYLNVILTVIALLLTLNLWTQWTGSSSPVASGFATTAQAQGEGLPNAGAQRVEMIALLRKQIAATESLTALLKSGTVKVKVDMEEKK